MTYGTGGHTNELVMLSAWGAESKALTRRAGGWYPGTWIIDNTQIFEALVEATGMHFND